MTLSRSVFHRISQILNHPIGGVFIFLLASLYNYLAQYSLILRSHCEPSIITPSDQIHPSAILSPWGVKISSLVIIGEKTIIKPRTTIGEHISIGARCIIGNPGFQVIRYQDHRLPIIHTGKVVIGDRVSIGIGTCIDRGLLGKSTSIGSDTHIGEKVHIGHNIIIGKNCHIGDRVTIGGNTIIGERVIIADNAVISNRISIASDSIIRPRLIITRDINQTRHP